MLRGTADSAVELSRPRLPPQADTNDARAYYAWARRFMVFGNDLDSAEMAFYWACRLDPAWADPVYARAIVILRALRNDVFETYWRTHSLRAARGVELTPRQTRLVDSLQRVAWARNPFLFSEVDFRDLFPWTGKRATPEEAGWHAFINRKFAAADSLFGVALRKRPGDVGLRVFRAQARFFLERYDAAVEQLETARDSIRAIEREHVAILLPSIEMFDYAIGIVRVQQDDFPAARAAFERALTENLAFYWAHARLAGAALTLGDTTAALNELAMAVQLEERDPVLRLYYGVVLHAARRLDEAARELRAAIELDSDYAAPYHRLGAVYQSQGRIPEAIVLYSTFLARAAKRDPDRATVTHALETLGVTPPD